MKKHFSVFTILTAGFLSVVLSSCSLSGFHLSSINEFYSNEVSRKFKRIENECKDFSVEGFYEAKDSLLKYLIANDENNTKEIIHYGNLYFDYLDAALKSYVCLSCRNYANGSEELNKKVNQAYSDLLEIYNTRHEIFEKAYNSCFRFQFYGDMEDDEIVEILEGMVPDPTYDDLEKHITEIENKARIAGTKHRNDSNYEDIMFEYLNEYMDAADEFSEYVGFDNFLDYRYTEYYGRNYTADDATGFFKEVKEKMLPLYRSIDLYLNNECKNALVGQKDIFTNINFRNKTLNLIKPLEDYIQTIGPLETRSYYHLWNNGIYLFSKSENSQGTAFTWDALAQEPLVFFSKDYQDLYSFVHEFGHYCHSYLNNDSFFCMDVEEIDSNGNEMLFTSYITNQTNFFTTQEAKDYVQLKAVKDQLRTIITTTHVAEIEKYVFDNPNLTKEELDEETAKIKESYGLSSTSTYWWESSLCSMGYYISYAVSSIGALQLFASSLENYETAVDQYVAISTRDDTFANTDELMESVGLKHINTAEAVDYIYDTILSIWPNL